MKRVVPLLLACYALAKIPPNPPFLKGGTVLTSPFSKGSELQARLTGLRSECNENPLGIYAPFQKPTAIAFPLS